MLPRTTSPRLDASDVRRAWGLRVRAAKAEAGLSSAEVAEAVGCHVATLSRWENGHVPIPVDQCIRLAEVLGADVAQLFAWSAS